MKFLRIIFLLQISILPVMVVGQISGSVYENKGLAERNSEVNIGKIFSNIQVQAYGTGGSGKQELITITQTDAKGNYFLNVEEGKTVKLVFGEGSNKLQSSHFTPKVQFVKSPATNINWQVFQPAHYISGNPYLVSPIYINGKGNDSLSALSALFLDEQKPVTLATSKQVGALWAVTYNRATKQLYSAALAKRHVGYGPLGTGGIYRTDWLTRTTTNWLDLQSLGIPTGDDHHEGLKAAIDSGSIDPKLMTDVGKLSLGGMDISEDTQVLYVMNLLKNHCHTNKIPQSI